MPPFILAGVQWCSACDVCGKSITFGIVALAEDGSPVFGLCIWCPLLALEDATGFNLPDMVMSFYASKKWRRKYKEVGWRTK